MLEHSPQNPRKRGKSHHHPPDKRGEGGGVWRTIEKEHILLVHVFIFLIHLTGIIVHTAVFQWENRVVFSAENQWRVKSRHLPYP